MKLEWKYWIIIGIVVGFVFLFGLGWYFLGSRSARDLRREGQRRQPSYQASNPHRTASTTPVSSTVPSASSTSSVVSSSFPASDGQLVIEGFQRQVTYQSGSLTLKGTLCKPTGAGPFAGVTYHHGGKEGVIGGAPEETCAALAAAGFVGFAPIRREALDFQGNLADLQAGLDYIKSLSYVDPNQLGVIGFSRGGLLTYLAAFDRSDLAAVVLLAPAPPQDGDYASRAGSIMVPVRILVAENDLPSKLNGGENLVEVAEQYQQALQAAGKPVELQIQPAYQGRNDGHLLFFELGDYWDGVVAFLRSELGG